MRRGRALLAIAVVCGAGLGLFAMRAAAKDVDPVKWCQIRLSVIGRKFFHQWSGEISRCQQQRMKGEFPASTKCYPDEMFRPGATTFCQPADDPDVPPIYQGRLCRAELHSHDKVQRKCTDDYLEQFELGVPCGTASTVAVLQDCINFNAHGQNGIDFARTIYGSVGRVQNQELRECISTIFNSGQTYARKVMAVMGDKCEVSVRNGKVPPPCPDAVARKRLNTARRSFAQQVMDKCESELAGHLVPFGPPCDALINPTPSDYIDCVATVAETIAMRGVSTVWPGGH